MDSKKKWNEYCKKQEMEQNKMLPFYQEMHPKLDRGQQ